MMKLGFTTLGCPDWPYATILARAQEYGFDGFEIRGMMGEMDLLKVPELQPGRRAATLEGLPARSFGGVPAVRAADAPALGASRLKRPSCDSVS